MQLSIIIPVYNEEKIISNSIKKIDDFFNDLSITFEIIAVDDGSSDNSLAELKKLSSTVPSLNIVTYKNNRGKGYAVKEGALAAQGEQILFMDADLATPLNSYHEFIKQSNQYDIIIGSRATAGSQVLVHQNIFKVLLGKLGNKAIKTVLGLPFNDTQCGFKLFKRDKSLILFEQMRLERWGFDFEFLFLAHQKNISTVELPVVWSDDGQSAVRSYEYIFTLRDLFRVRWWFFRGKYLLK